MPILHVRNVPEALYRRLHRLAQRSSRSLSAEVITLLDEALQAEEARQAQISLLADIQRRRLQRRPNLKRSQSVAWLRADRQR